MNNKFLNIVLNEIFKRLDLVIGQDFRNNFVVTLVTISPQDQQKRESFENPEFLNKNCPLALLEKNFFFYVLQQILQLQISLFETLIIALIDARLSADFV